MTISFFVPRLSVGWSGGAMVLGRPPLPGRPTIWWGLFGHFYSHLSVLFSFSLSLGDGPIYTEILSQRAFKPQNNRPTNRLSVKKRRDIVFGCLWWVMRGARCAGRDTWFQISIIVGTLTLQLLLQF